MMVTLVNELMDAVVRTRRFWPDGVVWMPVTLVIKVIALT